VHARDIATPLTVVDRTTPALDAVRLIADRDLVGLVVAETDGHPSSVVSSLDVVRYLLPGYLLDDLSLTNTVGDIGLEDLRQGLDGRTIGDLIDDADITVRSVLVVPDDAGPVEIAARMVAARTQVALVQMAEAAEPLFVTLPGLLDAIVAHWGTKQDGADA
jgi:CBS domain-containing protein